MFITIFHNDPLLMSGSKSKKERMDVIKKSSKIIFISKFVKNQFFKDLDESKYLDKYEIIYHGIEKIRKKQKLITFVGKLNASKGFDLFMMLLIKF